MKQDEILNRFDYLTSAVHEVRADVKSLLATRAFTRGMIRMAMVLAGAVSAAVSVLVAVIRGS
mgnify:CR=1 FL=1